MPRNLPENGPNLDETFSGVAASQLQARPCCVPGGSRPLLAADDLSGWFADPVLLARTQAGPTGPRRQCAAGPRTLSRAEAPHLLLGVLARGSLGWFRWPETGEYQPP
jgi:hypothetical protein